MPTSTPPIRAVVFDWRGTLVSELTPDPRRRQLHLVANAITQR